MAKKIIFGIIIIFFLSIDLFGVDRQIITFHLRFGFVKGGETTTTISDTTINGKRAIHYFMGGKTTGLTDKLFRINDIYESIVNPETLLPYKSIRNVKEGDYRSYDEVLYSHDVDSIISKKSGRRKVPSGLVDILTVFFYFTNQTYLDELNSGKIITIPVLNGDDISDVKIQFQGFKTIRTGIGNKECYLIAPQMYPGKVLMNSNGLRFYITKDERLPVLLEFDMKVGTLKAILHSYNVNGREVLKSK